MTETALTEQTIADAHRAADLDAKLAAAAERNRARQKSEPAPIGDITARLLAMADAPRPTPNGARSRTDDAIAPSRIEIPDSVRRAIIPTRFDAASFENYEPANPSQKAALRTTRRWVECARNHEGPMLALIGKTGTGKSHLLYAAVNALLGTHYPAGCYARPWYRLADELRYGGRSPFSPRMGTLEAFEVRSLLWDQNVVLLDEVRATASTAFDDTELAKFSCHAYDAKLSVLITSNVSPLADVMGPPAASRFTQVIVEGPDWRQT